MNWRLVVAGLVYFVVVPVLLVVLFLVPWGEDVLVLHLSQPTLVSLFGSHFFHADLGHLFGNLFFYLFCMVFIFCFDGLTNRRMLWVNMLLFFVVIPVVVSLVDMVLFTNISVNITERGFSAVVSGVYGYLMFSTLHFIQRYGKVRFEKPMVMVLLFVFLMNLWWITVIYQYYAVAVVFGVVVMASFVLVYRDVFTLFDLMRSKNRLLRIVFPLGLFCLAQGVFLLFPQTIRFGETTVNVFGHYLGYVVGFLVPPVLSYVVGGRVSE